MQQLFKIPLLFLFIGSILGVFLRWQFIAPTSGINYSFFLHGHSHIMFLGWAFNVLYLAFVSNHLDKRHLSFYKRLFFLLQALTLGMLISFPLQGYGFWSILLSTLHTVAAIVFSIRYLVETRQQRTLSAWFSRASLLFFVLSTAGPFSLGYLMANGMANSNWYNFSIYFYLHFQYNGFFFFGVLALFFFELERLQIIVHQTQARLTAWLFALSCIPAYLLSTLWAKPAFSFNVLASVAALVQCAAFVVFLKLIFESSKLIIKNFHAITITMLTFSVLALAVKFALQVASAFPFVAQLALELRPVVIAYLHLMLVGVITSFLLAWYIHGGLINAQKAKLPLILFLISFVGMEIVLVLSPWWSTVRKIFVLDAATYNLVFAAFLSVSFILLLAATRLKPDKSQFSN